MYGFINVIGLVLYKMHGITISIVLYNNHMYTFAILMFTYLLTYAIQSLYYNT